MTSSGESELAQPAKRRTRLWLTTEQEHAIAELIGPDEAESVRIAPGLFDDDPVSLSLGPVDGRRTYLIAKDGRAWTTDEPQGVR